MAGRPEVIITGFADEGPVDKKAEAQLTMLAALGLSHYSIRFIDAGDDPALSDNYEVGLVDFLFVEHVLGFGYIFFGRIKKLVVFMSIPDKIS